MRNFARKAVTPVSKLSYWLKNVTEWLRLVNFYDRIIIYELFCLLGYLRIGILNKRHKRKTLQKTVPTGTLL